jgi:hypothetical protein
MTARQAQKNRMTAAAAARTAAEAKPAGQTAVRTKPVRITIDLDPADYLELKRWLETAGAALKPDFPRPVQQMQAVKAMIRATITDDVVNSVVVDLLRKDQTQP